MTFSHSILATLSFFLTALSLSADVISVNFHAADTSSLAEHRLASGEEAGLESIDGSFWNNINLAAPAAHSLSAIFPSQSLKDNQGNANAVTIAPSVNSTFFVGYAASNASTAAELSIASSNHDDLYNSYLALNGPSGAGSPDDAAILNITNLTSAYTAGGYSVIVYSDSDKIAGNGTRASSITLTPGAGGGAATTQSVLDAETTFNGTYTDGINYTIFTGLTADNFTMEITSPGAGGRGAINGFQIVASSPLSNGVLSFEADDLYVAPGDPVTLSWSANNATSFTIDQGVGTVTGTNHVVNPTTATTYTITATFPDNTQLQSSVAITTGPPRPNIVVFLVDDMGITDTSVPFARDSSGNLVNSTFNQYYQTPNMEALAAQGMKFTQAYATPVCSSTRTSLMTGFNTMRHGVISQVTSSGSLDPFRQNPQTPSHGAPLNWKKEGMEADDITMPALMKTAGYRTIHSGKGHYGSNGGYADDPAVVGFDINIAGNYRGQPTSYTGDYGNNLPGIDTYENTGTFLTDAITQGMNAAIGDAVNDGVPFFAYMSHYAVHSPFTTDPNATGDYSTARNNSHEAFSTMVEGMDQSLGAIISHLNTIGAAEDTLIIFMGDNGSDSPAVTTNGLASGIFSDMPIRGEKATQWEGGIRVPMIVSWASANATNSFQTNLTIPADSIEDDIVTVWDIMPTVLSLTSVTAPHAFDGYDLAPYLKADPGTHRPQQMLMYLPIDHKSDFFSLYRDEKWKLIYFFATDQYQLYDLDSDPTESSDIAAANPVRVMRMARSMAKEFNDGWGIRGELWPRLTVDDSPDPLTLPNLPNVDSDNDGIPDLTEDINKNGIIDAGETDPDNNNTDGDNVTDGAETKLGLDPLDPNSFFSPTMSTLAGGDLQLTWPSAAVSTFTIRSSTDLSDWSTVVATAVAASSNGSTTSHNLGNPVNPKTFYRIELE